MKTNSGHGIKLLQLLLHLVLGVNDVCDFRVRQVTSGVIGTDQTDHQVGQQREGEQRTADGKTDQTVFKRSLRRVIHMRFNFEDTGNCHTDTSDERCRRDQVRDTRR